MMLLLTIFVLAQDYTWTVTHDYKTPHIVSAYANVTYSDVRQRTIQWTYYTTQVSEWTCQVGMNHPLSRFDPQRADEAMTLVSWTGNTPPHTLETAVEQSTYLIKGRVQGKDNSRAFLDHCAPAIPTLPDEVKKFAPSYFDTRAAR